MNTFDPKHPLQQVKIRSIRALRGPNLYAYMPVLHVVIDIGKYDDIASSDIPGFTERLVAMLPGLEKHECSVGRPGGFIERLNRGTYLAHIAEHITLELQSMLGFDVAYGRARGTGEDGVYDVVIAYREEETARAAFELALRLILTLMNNHDFDFDGEFERLMNTADEYRLGPSTAAIVKAARRRGIPILRLTPTASLVQLGYGVYQRRIQASETSYTSSIAVEMCQEKTLTNNMLNRVGVPVPEGRAVSSADDAWDAALEIGLPVVLKPEDGNQGKGVSVNLQNEAQVRAAYELARQVRGGKVLVEKYIEGDDHRLLIVNGKLVAAARREPAHVIGDGEKTVLELVEIVNHDPRRRPGHSSALTRIELNEAAQLVLQQQGMTFDSIPEKDQRVTLRKNSNLSTGGTAIDVTDDVHPKNARIAELAAQILSLDVAGIDVVCKDITRPLDEQHGAIVEVNAAPGLRMHLYPAEGLARDVAAPIVDMLYPDGTPSRIPIIAVTGTNGKTTVTRLIAHMYETAHWVTGMTSTNGVYINRERIMAGDSSGPKSAQAVLLHPYVEVAVLETARGGILREGLAFDRCKVGVVTNISADHLGIGGINTLEELARVKQVVVEAVDKDGAVVLNADDPLVSEMAAVTDSKVFYFSMDANNHIVAAHLRDEWGGAVFVDDGMIVVVVGDKRYELVELERIEFTSGGKIRFQVQNALAAVAAAWAEGLNPAMIVRALTTFKTDFTTLPGRFNRMDMNGVEVIMDYGHNAGAMKAMREAVQGLEPRRTVMVIGLPGDRRDEDLAATFDASLAFVDEYILHDLKNDLRGREHGEIPRLMRSRLSDDKPYEFAADQQEGIFKAWRRVSAGDRIVIVADEVDETVETLKLLAESEDAGCVFPVRDDSAGLNEKPFSVLKPDRPIYRFGYLTPEEDKQ